MPEGRQHPNFNRSPVLVLAVCFAAGILVANFVPFSEIILPAILAFVFMALALLLSKYRVSTLFITLAFVAAGAVSWQGELKQNTAPERLRVLYDNGTLRSGEPVEIEGVLLGQSEPSVDGFLVNLLAEKITYRGVTRKTSGNVRLYLQAPDQDNFRSEISHLKYGSRIRLVCQLEREDSFLNPGVIPTREILDRMGVDANGSIKSSLLVENIADESVFLPLAWIYDQRGKLIEDFRSNLRPPAAGVMIASLLGDKYFLDKNTADLFRDGGTFHILVISGLHITFIGGLLLLFLRQITRNRLTQFVITVTVLWAYTLAGGADVPVVRAAIMFTVISLSYVIYRQGSLLNSLGVCGLILLVWRPSDIYNPSFQLTFVSVAAIIAMAYPLIETLRSIGKWTPSANTPFPPNVPVWLRRFCETLYWKEDAWKIESKRQIWTAKLSKRPYLPGRVVGAMQSIVRYLFEGTIVSLVVQIWMLPLLVVYFHRVSAASVLLNLWVSLFIALESFAAVIGVLANRISALLAAPFLMLAEIFNWLMLLVPRLFSDNGLASFRLPAYSGNGRSVYFLYLLPVLLIALAVNRWKPFELIRRSPALKGIVLFPAFAGLFLLSFIIVFHPFSSPRPDGRLRVDFLDVGQGDAALVTFPDGKTLLVDGGGRIHYKRSDDEDAEPFEPDVRGVGEAVVSEFLWYRGYSRIDHILATHADADHIQGLTDVAKNFGIGSAVFGRMPMNDADHAELAEVLRRRGIPVEMIGRGDRLQFGDVTVEVLYPTPTDDLNAVSDNNNSVVLRIIYGSRLFLLTGDIERAAETELLTSVGTLGADLIKVAHHGSRTSSAQEFVNAVGAKYAVISVGNSSPFGHPHRDVVDRWQASGAVVMTTGERGMISVSTNGIDLEINTFVP